jgi:hypothetical protein
MNLIFRRIFVCLVSPVNGIVLRIPGLWRTENLPKLPSFSVNPCVPRLWSSVHSRALKARDHSVDDHLGFFLR